MIFLFNVCTKINKAIKMHHCIGDYRSVHIKMKMDLIYLNVILSIMFEKGFKKRLVLIPQKTILNWF